MPKRLDANGLQQVRKIERLRSGATAATRVEQVVEIREITAPLGDGKDMIQPGYDMLAKRYAEMFPSAYRQLSNNMRSLRSLNGSTVKVALSMLGAALAT